MISDVLQKKQILDIHSLIFLVATIGISIAEKINLRNVPLCEKNGDNILPPFLNFLAAYSMPKTL